MAIDTSETEAIIAADPTPVQVRREGLTIHPDAYQVRLLPYPVAEELAEVAPELATVIALPWTPLTRGSELRTEAGECWVVLRAATLWDRGRVEAAAAKADSSGTP